MRPLAAAWAAYEAFRGALVIAADYSDAEAAANSVRRGIREILARAVEPRSRELAAELLRIRIAGGKLLYDASAAKCEIVTGPKCLSRVCGERRFTAA